MNSIPNKLLEELAEKWLNGTLTPDEEIVFNHWYEQHSDKPIIVESEKESREAFRDMMLANIRNSAALNTESVDPRPKHVRIRQLRLFSLGAAAVLLIGFGLFRLLKPDAADQQSPKVVIKDVTPGGDRAILTLANGRIISLDSMHNGRLASFGNVTVTKASSGSLVYKANGKSLNDASVYNKLSTPRGGRFSVILPDGTKVWLNASSTLRYPTAFTGDERKVEMTGEAYFEVVHNAAKPFSVQIGNALIEDIGTHFNVNCYSNEPNVKVTLLEGAVKINQSLSHSSKVLMPGEQAQINSDGVIKLKEINAKTAIAWKNGLFNFDGSDLKGIMRQLERWYNISVVYAPNLPDYRFGGDTYTNSNLSEVLKVLELNGIHFKLEKGDGKEAAKLTVNP